jgi:hypothetical protein
MSDRNDPKEEDSEGKKPESTGRKGPEKGQPERKRREFPRRRSGPNNYDKLPDRSLSKPSKPETEAIFGSKTSLQYNSGVLQVVEALTGSQPFEPFQRDLVTMSTSELFDVLSESVFQYVEVRSLRAVPLVSLDDIRTTFRYVLAARIGQTSSLRLQDRPAEIRYPSLLGPLLASIGKYIHPTAAFELVPSLAVDDPVFQGIVIIADVNKERRVVGIQKPALVDRVLSILLAMGMPMNIGLPVEILVDSDEMFRLADV